MKETLLQRTQPTSSPSSIFNNPIANRIGFLFSPLSLAQRNPPRVTPPAVDLFALNIRKHLLGSTVQVPTLLLRLNPNQMPRKFVQDNLFFFKITFNYPLFFFQNYISIIHWIEAVFYKHLPNLILILL